MTKVLTAIICWHLKMHTDSKEELNRFKAFRVVIVVPLDFENVKKKVSPACQMYTKLKIFRAKSILRV